MKKLFMFSAVFLCFCASVFFAASDGAVEIALVPAAKAAAIVDSGMCGDNVTYTLDDEGTLTISGEGEMYSYSFNNPWPWKRQDIYSVIISNGITSIRYDAFDSHSNLTSVTIPESVKRIGGRAFYWCTSLTNITVPDSIMSIGDRAFEGVPNVIFLGDASGFPWGARAVNGYIEDGLVYENSSKTKLLACPSSRDGTVVIPNSVTSISYGAFYDCRSLANITIPDSVTVIGESVFSGCSNLTSMTLPNRVASVGANTFYKCSSLVRVSFPNSVIDIGNYAFYGCSDLTNITIPNSVTSIGDFAFYNVPNTVYSGTASGSPWGARALNGYIEDGLVYEDSSKTKLLACPSSREGTVVIPNSVTSIGEHAFSNCSSLKSVTIPDRVKSISNYAFINCKSLKDVFILNPNCLTEESEESIFANSPITIHSHTGYGVEKYAQKYGYNFVLLHMWDNGTVTREPQVGVAGERTFTCTVCSATRTEEIAPLVPSAPDRIEVKSSDSAKELTGGIVGATHSVTVSELLASSNASYVVDKDGNRVTDTKPLATGMKIILESGGERLEKVISVLGDVNGDGDISVSDARGALRAAVGLDTLEGAYLNAARVNGSNEVAVSDARSILRAAVALDTGKDWLANIK